MGAFSPVTRAPTPAAPAWLRSAGFAFALRDSAWLAFLPSGSGDLARMDGRQSKPSAAGPWIARARPLPAARQAGWRRIAAPPDTRADEATAGSEMRFARHRAFAFASLCTPASSDFRRHLTFDMSGSWRLADNCPLDGGVRCHCYSDRSCERRATRTGQRG
jgi:hypothetical protein